MRRPRKTACLVEDREGREITGFISSKGQFEWGCDAGV
jgi:hypothetical protein